MQSHYYQRPAAMTNSKQYREGGWGWFVVLACFMAEFVVYGTLKAFGVLITAMKEDLNTDLWIIGSITSLHIGVHFTLGMLNVHTVDLFPYFLPHFRFWTCTKR